jgi:glycosyltransferase involved in cell wall biosynthesis
MNADYKFTVMSPVYNKENCLEKSINSLLMQKTNFPFQILIIDGHSTDNSIKLLKDLALKHSNIRLILQEKHTNLLCDIIKAYGEIKTPYFRVLDPDDYLTDEYALQKAYDFFENNPEYTIYTQNVLCKREKDGKEYPYIILQDKEKEFSIEDFFSGKENAFFAVQTVGVSFRNVIFKNNGVPKDMTRAVGASYEQIYDGDTVRFFMHLKYGKAKFLNEYAGVYNIVENGGWTKLEVFLQSLYNSYCYICFDKFYEGKYKSEFYYKAYEGFLKLIDYLKENILTNDVISKNLFSQNDMTLFFDLIRELNENRNILLPKKTADDASSIRNIPDGRSFIRKILCKF